MQQPRGVRNHNPGNIRRGAAWVGMAREQHDADFVVFDDERFGLRALAVLLRNYQRVHGLRSIADIIARYAPNTENNTRAYASHVAAKLNRAPQDEINLEDRQTLRQLMGAIVIHENGRRPGLVDWYTDATYEEALTLACVK